MPIFSHRLISTRRQRRPVTPSNLQKLSVGARQPYRVVTAHVAIARLSEVRKKSIINIPRMFAKDDIHVCSNIPFILKCNSSFLPSTPYWRRHRLAASHPNYRCRRYYEFINPELAAAAEEQESQRVMLSTYSLKCFFHGFLLSLNAGRPTKSFKAFSSFGASDHRRSSRRDQPHAITESPEAERKQPIE